MYGSTYCFWKRYDVSQSSCLKDRIVLKNDSDRWLKRIEIIWLWKRNILWNDLIKNLSMWRTFIIYIYQSIKLTNNKLYKAKFSFPFFNFSNLSYLYLFRKSKLKIIRNIIIFRIRLILIDLLWNQAILEIYIHNKFFMIF